MTEQKDTTKTTRIPDHVQLRLRMSDAQIQSIRRRDKARGLVCDGLVYDGTKANALYNEETRQRYPGVTKAYNPAYSKAAHYRYHAGLARDIASKKEDRKPRKYGLRMAKKYEELANESG